MADRAAGPGTAAAVRDLVVREGGQPILTVDDWTVDRGCHTVVLGPNGAGKSTALRVLSGYRFPTTGTVDVLGQRLGRVDLRSLRQRIGIVNGSLDDLLDRVAPVRDLVAGALQGLTDPTRRQLEPVNVDRAAQALALVAATHLGGRSGGSLSAGEWQRVRLARALVLDPDLLLLDEPCVGLDLAQRAQFLAHLEAVLSRPDAPTAILVTHHLEEIPTSVTHALLLRDGEVVSDGPLEQSLTSATVSATYGIDVEVGRDDGHHRAIARI